MNRSESQEPKDISIADFLLRGGTWVFLARFVALVAGFVVQMLLARLLDPSELGAYFLVQSTAMVLALVGQLGLPRMIVRMVAQAKGIGDLAAARGALVASFQLAAVGTAAIACLYALGGARLLANYVFNSEMIATVGILAAAWIVTMAFQNLLSEALRGLFAVGMAAWTGGALANVVTGLLLGFVWLFSGSSDLAHVLTITICGVLVNIVIAALVIQRKLSGVSAATRPSKSAIMKGANALLVTTVAQMAFSQCDLWIVGAALAEGDVALYGAAKRLIRLLYFPLLIVTLVVPPIIADLHSKKEFARLERAIRGSATLAGLPAMFALLAMMFAADEILGLTFGDFYRSASLPLLILSIERMIYVWAGPSGLVLMMTGQERRMLVVTMATGVVQIVATLIGVEYGGIVGAAAGLLIGGVLRSLMMWNAARIASSVRTDIDFLSLGSTAKLVKKILLGK